MRFARFVARGIASLCLACALVPAAQARLTAAEIERLDKDLTPIGAERAGNADGSIPPWKGGMTAPPAGWTPEQGYVDPFAGEKPLFVITAQNVAQHKDRLATGTLAMFEKYPASFRMPVYPTHRTAALPAAVTANARAQAGNVELNGFGLKNLGGSNIPFPIPKSGLELIWNHLVRYLSGGVERIAHSFPVRPNGDTYKIGFRAFRIYDQNMEPRSENRLFSAMGFFIEPPTLKGTTFLVWEPIDQVAERRSAWIYNAGARRVRRAPDLGYDGINDGSEGLITTDQVDGYNGAPDRYDWKIVGKRELFIPYNSYRIGEKSVKYADIIRPGHANPDYMRYELHRVWVLEATLKSGMSHIYARRTFYIDEDSWTVVLEDAWTARGTLWRHAMHGIIQHYDAKVPGYRFGAVHDLDSGAYMLGGLDNEVPGITKFDVKGKLSDFQADSRRRIGGTSR